MDSAEFAKEICAFATRGFESGNKEIAVPAGRVSQRVAREAVALVRQSNPEWGTKFVVGTDLRPYVVVEQRE